MLGTSTGHLQLHSSDGQLMHRQRLHAKAVTAMSVRCAGMQAGSDDASEDVTVCFEDAVARVSSLEVWFLPCMSHITFCVPRSISQSVLEGAGSMLFHKGRQHSFMRMSPNIRRARKAWLSSCGELYQNVMVSLKCVN